VNAALPKWSIREYRADDVSAVHELFKTVYHSSRPLEHYIWKFHENPVGRGIIMLAEDSTHIVGQYALMPTRLRLGNEVVLGAQSLDTMTHPDYRNQGMFTVLAKSCMELAKAKGVEVLYGFPNESAYHGFVHSLNWDHTGDISMWMRFLNPKLLSSYSRLVRQLASLCMPMIPLGNANPKGVEIRMERPTWEQIDSLTNSESSGVRKGICRIERSIDWIKWRFDNASQRNYIWFSAYRDGDLAACAVFGLNDWGDMPLVDMTGSDTQALEGVVSRATRCAKEHGLPQLAAITNYPSAERALKSCGYQPRLQERLIVRSLTTRTLDANIHLHSSWRIASADVDTF